MNRIMQDIKKVTCGIVLFNSELNKVWLKRRSEDSLFPNTFSIPGGKLKLGEAIEIAVLRELYEETGLRVNNPFYLKTYYYDDISLFVFTGICDDDESDMVEMDDVSGLTLAPNIENAIRDAREYFNLYSKNLDVNLKWLLQDIIEKVTESVVSIDDKTGFDHFLCQQRVGTLGSAVGLNILFKQSGHDNLKQKVLKTIAASQISDGGWGIKSHDNKESILESTCYSLMAVSQFDNTSDLKDSAIAWIIDNRLSDGSWGANKNSSNGKVTSTCLAVNVLQKLGMKNEIKESILWLYGTQNKDGGWGFEKGKTSNVTATSQAIVTLLGVTDKNEELLEKAKEWLVNRMNSSKIREESEVSYLGEKRFEYKHSTIVYALIALAESGCIENVNPGIILQTISSILDNRDKNGFWEHEATPGFYPIWHTYNIVNLLISLVKKCDIINFSTFRQNYEHYQLEMDFINLLINRTSSEESHTESTRYYR